MTEPLAPRIAALVLAAGRGRRMGAGGKLLRPLGGRPMVRRVVDTVLAAGVAPLLVVTAEPAVRAALADLPVGFIDNPDPDAGLSQSLRCGVAALPAACDGVLICLGDMPLVRSGTMRSLCAAFRPGGAASVWVPVQDGRRGNPVLWARHWFGALMELAGDAGARSLLASHPEAVQPVAVDDPGVLLDVDDATGLERAEQALARGPVPG